MRRADRLFRIVQLLRSGRFLSGAQLAQRLEVSVRTIYRDIAELQMTGIMIEGAAGVGYTLRKDMDLPPTQFTAEEATALVLGARMVSAWAGKRMGAAAREALGKIEGVATQAVRARMDAVQLFSPPTPKAEDGRGHLDQLHDACIAKHFLRFRYNSIGEVQTHRRVRPLALAFWGGVWTLATWCETRNDFRVFRADRIEQLVIEDVVFTLKARQGLPHFLRLHAAKSSQVQE